MNEFKNDHLSYSRLTRFEQCPLSFKLHYIDKLESSPNMSLRFGKVIHAVLERLFRELIEQELTGMLSEERALELYSRACMAEGLLGFALFEEGVEILKDFIRREGVVDHRNILAVEKEFEIKAGPFPVCGFIDRVDNVDDETINVIDYKTNRVLFTREEVDTNLQLSLYQIVAHKLWPWAKKVKLTFHMLRHGICMETERTPEQLDAALRYIETLGRMTEETETYEPRLNTNCIYCDHQAQCPAYAEALEGKQHFICKDIRDLEAVAKEREEVSQIAKVAYARKKELEDVLKTHLKDKDELVLGGMRYAMFNTAKVVYPLMSTLEVLEQSGLTRDELLEQIATVDNKAVEKLLKEIAKPDKHKATLLKAELGAVAKKTFSPKFWAKEVKP
jgi:putative RecB family exonuclease